MESTDYKEQTSPIQNTGLNLKEIFSPFSNMKLICLIAWLLVVITAFVSFAKPDYQTLKDGQGLEAAYIFWLTLSFKTLDETAYMPGAVYIGFYNFCFSSLIVFLCLSCILIFYNVLYNSEIINGMFEKFSKFHFIPLLCISALFIIGETLVGDKKTMIKSYELICSLDFIFTIIGIGSLIFLYLKTDLSSSRSLHLIIKQGTFGCALALLVYNLFFSVFVCGTCALTDKNAKRKELNKFFSDCYLSLSVLIGIVNLIITFVLKNIMTGITNLFLYIGMIIWFFKISIDERANNNNAAEGIIQITIVVINLGVLFFLFKKFSLNEFKY